MRGQAVRPLITTMGEERDDLRGWFIVGERFQDRRRTTTSDYGMRSRSVGWSSDRWRSDVFYATPRSTASTYLSTCTIQRLSTNVVDKLLFRNLCLYIAYNFQLPNDKYVILQFFLNLHVKCRHSCKKTFECRTFSKWRIS